MDDHKVPKHEKGARQGDPVSACLFILCVEIRFMLLKKKIKSIKIFEKIFFILLTQLIVLFLKKDKNSVKELLNTINYFSSFTGLKPNLSKCEICGIATLKGVKVSIYGIKCIDLTKEAIKILGVFFFS